MKLYIHINYLKELVPGFSVIAKQEFGIALLEAYKTYMMNLNYSSIPPKPVPATPTQSKASQPAVTPISQGNPSSGASPLQSAPSATSDNQSDKLTEIINPLRGMQPASRPLVPVSSKASVAAVLESAGNRSSATNPIFRRPNGSETPLKNP